MSALHGKIILVTRAAHQAGEFVRLIEQAGGTAVVFPTIEIVPPDSWDACDRAIEALFVTDGLLFTSSNAVDFFFHRMRELKHLPVEASGKMIFTVGEKTKQYVEKLGLRVTAVPEKFTSFDLARMLQQEDLHGRAFLFPKGNLAKENLSGLLRSLGASVDEVVVYKTVPPKRDIVELLRSMMDEGKVDVATFTSPSTFQNFVTQFSIDELRSLQDKMKIAVIGPVTAKAVEDAGLDVDIMPPQSTIESLVETIVASIQSEVPKSKIP